MPKFIRVGQYVYRLAYQTGGLLESLSEAEDKLKGISRELRRGLYDDGTARAMIRKHVLPLLEGA